MQSKDFIIRPATLKDSEGIYHLSNDIESRVNSFNLEIIKLKEHNDWYLRKIKDDNCVFLVAELKSKGIVAQTRFNLTGDTAIISISVGKDYRGFGIGQKLMKRAISYLLNKKKNVKKIHAFIKPENTVSRFFFESFGFKLEKNTKIKNQRAYLYCLQLKK